MQYVGTETVSSHVGITKDHVRRLIRNGQLVAKKVEGMLEIHIVDLHRLKQLYKSIDQQDNLNPDILWIQEACGYLIKEIYKSNFVPKQIIAIANGGLVPAALIASAIKPPLFFSIKVTLYSGKDKLSSPIMGKFPDTIQHMPTLVVDDIADSGETLFLVKNELDLLDITDVRFAVLHKKSSSSFEPDWYVSEVDGWVNYPWEEKI